MIQADNLEKAVWEWFCHWICDSAMMQAACEQFSTIQDELPRLTTDKQQLKSRLSQIEAGRERLIARLASADPEDEELFQKQLTQLRKERTGILALIQECEQRMEHVPQSIPTLSALERLPEKLRNHPDTLAEEDRRRLFTVAGVRVVTDGKTFTVSGQDKSSLEKVWLSLLELIMSGKFNVEQL